MTLTGRVFPLFLLQLLAWTFLTHVHGQEVKVSLVSTHYVEVTWTKALLWMGVDDYNVNFTSEGARDCHTTINCPHVSCTFSSFLCGVVDSCTPTTTTVTGDEHSALPLNLVTAPEMVTNFSASLNEGVEYISWVNPSTDSSPCYEKTAVRVSFNDEDSISYFNHTQDSMSKALCVGGFGEVEVWTQGEDGRSNSSWETIIYNGSSVVDLVTFETCKPVGCTSLQVEWSYTPVCPDVEYLSVEVGDVRQKVTTNTSDLLVQSLEVDKEYATCIYAMNKDGRHLDYSCKYYCRTPYQLPKNLVVKARSQYTLYFTWDPPVCQKPPVVYVLRVDYHDYSTTETEYKVGGLSSFYEYTVRLHVGEGYYDEEEVVSLIAYTLPNSPSSLRAEVRQDEVYASWSVYFSFTWDFTFRYKVTWGRSLQHEEDTSNEYLWIKSFNSTDEVYQVCVAVYPVGRKDLMSDTSCVYVSASDTYYHSHRISGWVIAGSVLVVLALSVLGGYCAAVQHKKSKAQRRRQQQQQQQDVNPYINGISNPAANI